MSYSPPTKRGKEINQGLPTFTVQAEIIGKISG